MDLMKRLKIIAGGGDQATGAVGVVKDGVLSVALGTSGVVFAIALLTEQKVRLDYIRFVMLMVDIIKWGLCSLQLEHSNGG